jgi:predicted transcriptional regulator
MKKSNLLEVRFQTFNDFKKEVSKALSSKLTSLQKEKCIFFDSVASFRNFMTVQKVEILTVVANLSPGSIYELAKLVDRDFAAVLRDCTGLESAGFISLKDKKDPKSSKVPKLIFDYSGIAIYLPSTPYQIDFRKVA